jgi:hypothetical protein
MAACVLCIAIMWLFPGTVLYLPQLLLR